MYTKILLLAVLVTVCSMGVSAQSGNTADDATIYAQYRNNTAVIAVIEVPSAVLMLKRTNGDVNFNRNWADYENGFGDCKAGDCWLGLTDLYTYCNGTNGCSLSIDMEYNSIPYTAKYTTFKIGSPEQKYTLTLGGFTGGTGEHVLQDSFDNHNGQNFTTFDEDNDKATYNCAERFTGGWWHNNCHLVQLTGTWESNVFGKGLNWHSLTTHGKSLSSVTMTVKQN